jgi:hypothetical protein
MSNEWLLLVIALVVIAALAFGLHHLIVAAVRRGVREGRET